MALREILAELDVQVKGLGSVDEATGEINQYLAATDRGASAFEKLRIKQQEAGETASRLMRKIRQLQKAEGDHSTEINALRGAFIRAQEAARRYGREADRVRAANQRGADGSSSFATRLQGIGIAMASVAGAAAVMRRAIGGTVDFFSELVDTGDEIGKFATRVNLSAQEMQAWQFIADRADVSANDLDRAFRRLASNAQTGLGPWRELGINVRDSNGELRSQEELLMDVVGGLSEVENATVRSAHAQALFGRSGQQFLTIVDGGVEGIEELRDRFEELGGGMSEAAVDEAEKAKDAMTDFRLAMLSMKNALTADVLPAITRLITGVADFVGAFSRLAESSSILEVAIGGLAAVLYVLLGAMMPIILPLAVFAALLAGLFLVVEDVVTAFRGGDSVFGSFVERLADAMGVTATFAGLLELFEIGWTSTKASALDAIVSILRGLQSLQDALGVEIFSGLDAQIADAAGAAAAAVGAARTQIKTHGANEAARFSDRARIRAEATGGAKTTVNAQINVTGSGDPEATARAVQRELARSMRDAADVEGLAES